MKAFKPSREGALACANVILRIDGNLSVTMTPTEYGYMQALGGALVWSLQDELPPPPEAGVFVLLREFKRGDPTFIFTSQRSPIAAIPFTLPTTWSDPWGKAAASEGQSGGTGFSEAAINTTAGDMTGFNGSGSNLTIDFEMGKGIFQPGALLYYNHRMGEGHGPRGTDFSVEFPKP